MRLVTVTLSFLLVCGCATSPVRYDPARPIELHRRGLSSRYVQRGLRLDVDDMKSKLADEPASAPDIRKSRGLRFAAYTLAIAGGVIVGWQLGQAWAVEQQGGNAHPVWPLIGLGAGCIAIGIPFDLGAHWRVERAAEAHNRQLLISQRRDPGIPGVKRRFVVTYRIQATRPGGYTESEVDAENADQAIDTVRRQHPYAGDFEARPRAVGAGP